MPIKKGISVVEAKKRSLLLIAFLCLAFSSYTQISIQYRGTLKGLFSTVQNQYGYKFVYSNDEINDGQQVTINVKNSTIETVLNEIAKEKKISFRIINKQVIVKQNKKEEEKPADRKTDIPAALPKMQDIKTSSKPPLAQSQKSVEDSLYKIKQNSEDKTSNITVKKNMIAQSPISASGKEEIKETVLPPDQEKTVEVADTLVVDSSRFGAEKTGKDTTLILGQTESRITSDTSIFNSQQNQISDKDLKSKNSVPTSGQTKLEKKTNEDQKENLFRISTSGNNVYEFTLQNNLLYDVILTPNLGVECKINETWGISVSGLWTHIKWDNSNKTYRIWSVSPEGRFYFPENRRFYLGAMFHIGQLNLKLSNPGYQGDFVGGGLTGGYMLRLGDRFMLDFGIGLGYTYLKYDSYDYIDGVNIKNESGFKNFIGPTKVGITLNFKIK